MLFINTRPNNRALPLTEAMHELGVDVIELPLLELIEQPWSHALSQLYMQLSQAQIIVVVSPTAVEIGLKYLKQSGIQLSELRHITWVAVGEKTAEVLQYWQIQHSF